MFLYPECSYNRCSYIRHLLYFYSLHLISLSKYQSRTCYSPSRKSYSPPKTSYSQPIRGIRPAERVIHSSIFQPSQPRDIQFTPSPGNFEFFQPYYSHHVFFFCIILNTVDAGHKNIVGNCIYCSYNRHVLITGINYIGYMSTVFEYNVLISGMFL